MFFVAFLIFLYVPTVLLIIFSFNTSTVAAFPLAGLTLDWYREAFTDPQIRTALLNSLKVASACAVLATLLRRHGQLPARPPQGLRSAPASRPCCCCRWWCRPSCSASRC